MLYRFLKIFARFYIHLFCRQIRINLREALQTKGPLILAANHPNSFLDAVILDTLFEQPIWSLARGDIFHGKNIATVLTALKIMPVYRKREGAEHLHKNYGTFDSCLELFKKNGVVLIFSEALCENEWHLRPLKKGTARLAVSAWQQGIPLKILPVGINYSSFLLFGKNIHINFGSVIHNNHPGIINSENGKLLNNINEVIQEQLQQCVYEINATDKKLQAKIFHVPVSRIKKICLAIPAAIGVLVHFPLFIPLQKIIANKTLHSGHYDSIITGIFFLVYPVYLLLLSVIIHFFVGGFWWIFIFLVLPFTAWSYIQLSQQTDR